VIRVAAPPPAAPPSVRPQPVPANRSPQRERRGVNPTWQNGPDRERHGPAVMPGKTASRADVQALADQILKGRGESSSPAPGVAVATVGRAPANTSVTDVQTVADQILNARGGHAGQR
jgi:hypothetical protein